MQFTLAGLGFSRLRCWNKEADKTLCISYFDAIPQRGKHARMTLSSHIEGPLFGFAED
ncbi:MULTISPECIES: hypothetical protein [unclassified Paraburkholderia]|uniref:hypothetical protein n=1 Tax=unclassified Paraburkholderia TaxID=2615204 RepID=UPI002AB2E7E5|nr:MULTISPECIES: hypothetical protein [unclassified Paraburkholderia]